MNEGALEIELPARDQDELAGEWGREREDGKEAAGR